MSRNERWHVFGAFVLVAVVALGCRKKSGDDSEMKQFIDTQTPAARTKLASIKSVTQKAIALPRLANDGTYAGPAVSADCEDLGSLAFFFDVDKTVKHAINTPDPFIGVKHAVDGESTSFVSVGEAKSKFAEVTGLEYLLVLKAITRVDPVVESTGSFTAGHLVGEGHLFALEGERYIGGFRFESKTSDSIQVKAKTNQLVNKAQDELVSDFDTQSRAAAKAALQKFGGGKVTVTNL